MPEQNGNHERRRYILFALALLVIASAGAYGTWWHVWGRYEATTDDAYVNGNVVSLSPRVSGTVISINADDTDLVHAGDVVVRLDDSDANIAFAQAQADLAQTVRQVQQLFDEAAQAQASLVLQKASLAQAERDYKRAQELSKINGISTEGLQHAGTALETARAAYTETSHRLAASKAAVDGTEIATHPRVLAAEAQLRRAWLALQRTRVRAPVGGYVAKRSVQVGQQVQPGAVLMAIIPLQQVWVDANFKETDLAHVRIGQPVTLTADLYGTGHRYGGKVTGLAAGTGNAFALLPAQNATGNWIKVVQRLPVRIGLDPGTLKDFPLRIGLSMSVDIDTHDLHGQTLAESAVNGPRFSTSVYNLDETAVNNLIDKIVRQNVRTTSQ